MPVEPGEGRPLHFRMGIVAILWNGRPYGARMRNPIGKAAFLWLALAGRACPCSPDRTLDGKIEPDETDPCFVHQERKVLINTNTDAHHLAIRTKALSTMCAGEHSVESRAGPHSGRLQTSFGMVANFCDGEPFCLGVVDLSSVGAFDVDAAMPQSSVLLR
eukprot:scaffold271_cov336-Pavlova_lutheri.AAC.45